MKTMQMNKWRVCLWVLLGMAAILPAATTITVPGNFSTIQGAINAASSGDEIVVAPGTYYESIDFLGKAVRLYSSGGPAVTTIDGTGHYHVVQCVTSEGPNTILEGFTITGGNANGSFPDDCGGGMINFFGHPTIINCVFTGNSGYYGGGMSNYYSSPTVANCTLGGNTATYGGGMNNFYSSSPTVTNCTLSGNTATNGGGMYNYAGNPVVTNCILWGNNTDQIKNNDSAPAITYSDIQGWIGGGTGNIDADPLFVNAAGGDLRLRSSVSPCVDAGTNSASAMPTTDLAGNPRILDGDLDGSAIVDMGAYELRQVHNVTRDARYEMIQTAINDANNGDQIEVAPGTYHESINFLGKAVRLYSSGGPEVTTIDGFPPLLQENFNDGNYDGWEIIDQGVTDAPSAWSVNNGTLVQTSNICSDPASDLRMLGTYALWQAGTSWRDYQVTLTMRSQDNDAMGVMFRYQDENNYYRFSWLNEDYGQGVGRRQLVKMQNGQVTVLHHDDIPYTVGQEYAVKIIASWSNISVWIDGEAVLWQYDDSSFLGGSVALYCRGNQGTYFDDIQVKLRCNNVVQCRNDEGPGTVLEGFTITGGNANGSNNESLEYGSGAGMFNWGSSPTVTNCIFSDNTASGCGGGMCNCQSSSPTVTNCIFNGNAASVGGGMYNFDGSSPILINCTFNGNSASEGGGMCGGSSLTVTECTFSNNVASSSGGGMRLYSGGSPMVTDSTFSSNSAQDGGGINISGSATVTDCTFSGNSAVLGGGGMSVFINGSPTVTNCTFSDNSALWGGGMYNYWYSNATVINCTFSSNSSNRGGGIHNCYNGNMAVINCILWDTEGEFVDDVYLDEIYTDGSSSTIAAYSNIRIDAPAAYPGAANINIEPLFANAESGDFKLICYSRCIDAGSNTAVPAGITTDLAGNPRIIDGNGDGTSTVDMGAYEREPVGGGSLSVIIEPHEADEAGALWRIEGTAEWRSSGDVIQLTAGYYKVEFNDLSEWFEPETLLVTYEYDSVIAYQVPQKTLYIRVVEDMTAVAAAPYKPLPVFDIGQIPPRDAPHGRAIEFIADANSLGDNVLFSMTPSPAPQGTIEMDSNSGWFLYEPDPNDRVAFDVTFRAETAGDTVEQTVRVTPLPDNPPEYEIIGLQPIHDMPDSANPEYIIVNEETTDNVSLNGRAAATVKSVTIQGIEITLEDASGNPFRSYNGQVNIKDLTIYAETLIIKKSLWLPQTNVTIYARNLYFDDGLERVAINTTPDIPLTGTTDGLDAGNINLFIESYEANGGLTGRFVMNGTAGSNGEYGQPGELTCSLNRSQPLAWLSPYALKMVIARARDAYLYRHTAETHDILSEYAVLLNLYRELPQWNNLPSQWRFEFEQMQQEIDGILHRIENGLDFFGNPPDWVPALSFEVLKTAYDNEIDNAMSILYLSYWLQNKAASDMQKKDGLTSSRDQLWAQIEQSKQYYTNINELIGPLKSRADAIAAKIGRADAGGCYGLLGRLKQKEADLLYRAQQNVQDAHKVPWWQTAGRMISTIGTSMIKSGGAGSSGGAVGVIGGLFGGWAVGSIDILTDESLTNPNPWPQASLRTDAARQFSQIDFGQATNQWSSQFSTINLAGLEGGGAEGYLNSLSASAREMANGLAGVKQALRTTSLSNAEVEAKLSEIKATDPAFNQLIDEVVALNVEKEAFNLQLAAAMQQIAALSNSMTNNMLAIDAMNRTEAELNSGYNPRVMMYIKDMGNRSLTRLKKYHYYMAKAYEYRLMEPYPQDLNVQYIMDSMVNLASTDGLLSSTDFAVLKAVYENQLKDLAEVILNSFLNGHIERSVTTYYHLSEAERAQLNAQKPLTINFFTRGLFPSTRENIRIVDMRVYDMDVSVSGDCGSFAQLIMSMQHPSVSKLQLKDNVYMFRHLAQDTKEPLNIKWESEYDADYDLLEDVGVSASQQSLLWSLLNEESQSKALIYSRPAAWGDFIVTRTDNWDWDWCWDCDCQMNIESLTLEVKYDYYDKENSFRTLRIAAEPKGASAGWPQDLAPYFVVDTADVSGRQDGTGDFYRIYRATNTIHVTAPATFGYWRFDRWINKMNGNITPDPTRTITFTTQVPHPTVYAQYVYEGPILNAADFNLDYGVNLTDFYDLAAAWLTTPYDEQWDTVYDISNPSDDVIDLLDLQVFCENWLEDSLY